MLRKYQKNMVEMKLENDAYCFWKKRNPKPVCYVESYKEKRAVFFRGENLLSGKNYHLILIGSREGQLEHQDFGPLQVGGDGMLQCYQTFDGAPLSAYGYCLLCADKGEGEMDVIYKGSLFSEEMIWIDLCQRGRKIDAFSEGRDETGAKWFRGDDLEKLPASVARCLPWVEVYGHYIIGRKDERWFLGVPGRFLQKEQPLREEGIFLLWQPIRGGEAFFDRPDQMTRQEQEHIFGYWIAEVNQETGKLQAI